MRRAVIFLNGESLTKKRIKENIKPTDTIICADGGANAAFLVKIKPDVVIGDNDSLDAKTEELIRKNKIQKITFPRDKDQTDSELALNYALKRGFANILLVGFMGDRFDHVLALFLYVASYTKKAEVTFVSQTQNIFLLKKTYVNLLGKKGDYVSLLPLEKNVKVTTSGLIYGLKNESLQFAKTIGVSNEFSGEKARVKADGKLLVIQTIS